jgi:cysteine-rich repeat protein
MSLARSRFAWIGLVAAALVDVSACSPTGGDSIETSGGTPSEGGRAAGGLSSADTGGALGSGGSSGSGSAQSSEGGAQSAGAAGAQSSEGGAPLSEGGAQTAGAPLAGGAGGEAGADADTGGAGGASSMGGTLGEAGSAGGGPVPVCGNGRLEPPETCDDGDAITNACPYGLTSCAVCDATCKTTRGATAYCGDGVINTANGEGCDDKNAVTERCAYGMMTCTVCDAQCKPQLGATSFCGDGSVDASNAEMCDDKNSSDADTCSAACKTCGFVPGVAVTNPLSGWPNSGMQFTALTNSVLTQFAFNTQGKADTINLTRLSDAKVLYSVAVPATRVPAKTTMSVRWSLDAGVAYGLSNVANNGMYGPAPMGTLPATSSEGIIRVDRSFGTGPTSTTEYWVTYTDLHACLR